MYLNCIIYIHLNKRKDQNRIYVNERKNQNLFVQQLEKKYAILLIALFLQIHILTCYKLNVISNKRVETSFL